MAELDLTAFYGQFRDEAWENLNILEQGLTALEAQPDDTALLDRMLRAVHTTKGSAKIMGFGEINRLAHQIEEVLGAIRKGGIRMSAEAGSAMLQASQGIRALVLNRLEGRSDPVDLNGLLAAMNQLLGITEPAPAEAAPVVTVAAAAAGRPRETMRVDMELVDQLARLVGETLALQQQALAERGLLHDLEMAQEATAHELGGLKDRLLAARDRLRPRQAEEIMGRVEALEGALHQQDQRRVDFTRQHTALLDRFSLTLDELRQHSLAIRMVPIGTLFEIFPGVVRRMAGEAGVEVALEVRGADVELDRRVLDMLREPLVHMVRNALAHGIESAEDRVRQRKPRRGHLLLEAVQQGRRVQIHVRDDGRGIDLDKVRRAAVERGLIDEERAAVVDQKALLEFLFRPAFSTRRQADDLSGRGVGLDVVQSTMRQLNGFVHIQTEPGRGSTFTLDVPLTLATIRVLLVQAGEATLAIPTGAVRGLVRIPVDQTVPIEGRPTTRWQERTVPIHTLAGALGGAAGSTLSGPAPAVIAGAAEHPTAFLVDELVDEVEVVVRPLGDILGVSPYFSAATVVGTDQVIPILDLTSLLQAHAAIVSHGAPDQLPRLAPRDPPRILLVEDAITTRELERSILEAAGYRVDTAMDGVDALQKLEHGRFQLIITDIEMPRMDGFELTIRVRQEPRWATLPVIIISARVDEESRRRGLQAGAQGYIVKSRFDQGNLLGTISQLLG